MVDVTRPPARHRTRSSPNTQTAGSASSDGPAATAATQAQVRATDGPIQAAQERDACVPRPDYEVGFGKPPKYSRFKPGRSGNPRGRPKGSKNLLTLIDEELDRPIAVREDGRPRKVRARDALIKRLLQKALSGHDRSIELLFKLLGLRGEHGAVMPAEAAVGGAEPLTAGEQSILEDFRRQIIEEHELASRSSGADAADEQGGES
jgi:Family of unknown function (DUF5681)